MQHMRNIKLLFLGLAPSRPLRNGDSFPTFGVEGALSTIAQQVDLMRGFLASSLEVNTYYTVLQDAESAGESRTFRAVQVLELETKPVLVKTFSDDVATTDTRLYEVSVQALEIWNPPQVLDDRIPPELETFILDDPSLIDILALAGDKITDRSRWHRWETRESDIEGCMTLHSPTLVAPRGKLDGGTIPVLSLLDTLDEMEYEGVKKKVHHKDLVQMTYDCRKLAGARRYLQCVVSLPELLPTGITFASRLSQAFYELLLRAKELPTLGLPAKEYKRLLAELDGDHITLAALDRKPTAKKPRMAEAPQVDADEMNDIYFDDEVKKPSEVEGDTLSEAAGKSMDDHDNESNSKSSSSSSTSSEVVGDSVEKAVDTFPEDILGAPLIRVDGRNDETWRYHKRFKVFCLNPDHVGCSKSRSVMLDAEEFGAKAPNIYITCWLARMGMVHAQHRGYKPSRAEMKAYVGTV